MHEHHGLLEHLCIHKSTSRTCLVHNFHAQLEQTVYVLKTVSNGHKTFSAITDVPVACRDPVGYQWQPGIPLHMWKYSLKMKYLFFNPLNFIMQWLVPLAARTQSY